MHAQAALGPRVRDDKVPASGLSLIACRIAAFVLGALRFVAISVAIVLAATAALIRALRLFSSESEIIRVRRKAANSLMML